MRKLEINARCEYGEGCTEPAEILVYSYKREEVLQCCELHAEHTVDERLPEYTHFCENCNCWLSIN